MSVVDKLTKEVVRRLDGWANTLTGVGYALRDKVLSNQPLSEQRLPDTVLEALYAGDDLAARGVDKLPREALKHGFEVDYTGDDDTGKSSDEAKLLSQQMLALNVAERFLQASIWGRLYGGAAIIIGADDGQTPDKPLNEDRIKALTYLTVVDKRELTAASYYADPFAPKFGEVEIYRLQPSISGTGPGLSAKQESRYEFTNRLVHESRLVIFGGAMTEKLRKKSYNGFDDSVLQRVYRALQGANANWQSVTHLMADASQGVFKIKNLMAMIAAGQQQIISDRMQIVDMGRSVARSVVLDAEAEEFERVATSFAGLPEVIQQTWLRVAAAFEMPVTILMGMSPAGLNATGESDTRHWYDTVRAYREQELMPKIVRVLRLAGIALKVSDPEAWGIKFDSLWQMSPKEEAEYRKNIALADEIYIAEQVVTREEVTLSRWGGGEYSPDMKIDVASRKTALPFSLEKLITQAQNPDPEPDVSADPAKPDAPPLRRGDELSRLGDAVEKLAVFDIDVDDILREAGSDLRTRKTNE